MQPRKDSKKALLILLIADSICPKHDARDPDSFRRDSTLGAFF